MFHYMRRQAHPQNPRTEPVVSKSYHRGTSEIHFRFYDWRENSMDSTSFFEQCLRFLSIKSKKGDLVGDEELADAKNPGSSKMVLFVRI